MGDLDVRSTPFVVANYDRLNHERLLSRGSAEYMSGLEISEGAGLDFNSTGGVIYITDSKVTLAAQSTLTNKIEGYWYYNGSAWVELSGKTVIDNLQYNNVASGLAALGGANYGVHWVYMCYGGGLNVQYGQGNYTTATAATAPVPTPPPYLANFALLIGKIVVKKGAATFYSIQSALTTQFVLSTIVDHNDLAAIQGGTTDQYYHLTSAEYVNLEAGISVNNGPARPTGGSSIVIPKQPAVQPSGILQPMPPAISLDIVGTNLRPVTIGTYKSPLAIKNGFDERVWVTCSSSNQIAAMSKTTTITYYSTVSAPWSICTGSDGSMWYSAKVANKFGKITSAGVSTEYALTAGDLPNALCTGSDGNLFIVCGGTNSIAKCNTSGTVLAHYTIPTASASAGGICAGPDSNLWVCERGNTKIAKMTTNGSFTEISLGVTASPFGIASGADNNIWVTDGLTVGTVYRVNPQTNAVTTYTLTGVTGVLYSICSAADGYIWATGSVENVQIDTYGRCAILTSYPQGTGTSAGAMCAGEDGLIWVVQQGSTTIAAVPNLLTTRARNSVAFQYVVNGSVAGTLTYTSPEQGSSFKTMILALNGFNDAGGGTITFPSAFVVKPALLNGTSLAPPTYSATTFTIPATGGVVSGTFVLIGI